MIARKSVLIITTKILDGGLGYLGLFFITRFMSPADYGIVQFALGFVALFTIFTNLGFISAHVKRVSEGKDLGRCIGTFLSVRSILIIFSLLLLFGSLFFWTDIFGRGFETPEHLSAIYIIIGFWLTKQIAQSFYSTFQARKEIAKHQIPFLINGIIRTIAIIYVALSDLGALALAWTYVAGETAHMVMVFLFFKGYPIKKPTKEYLKSYGVFAFPLAFVVISSTVMNNIDKVFIQLFWAASDVGYYMASFRLSKFINMFTLAIGMLILPTYSRLHAKGEINQIKRLTYDAERHLSLVVFPMVFGLIVLAEPAAFILLSGWMPTVPIIQIISFYALFSALMIPYSKQFQGMNKPELSRNMVSIMVVCNLFLNFLLIPKDIQMLNINLFGLGARGAAIATVISYLAGLFYARIVSYRLIDEKGNIRIILHAIAGVTMGGILYVLLYTYNLIEWISRWYHLLFFAGLGLLIYLGILALFKEFTKEDFWFYIDALNIRKMINYIHNEIWRK